MIESDLGICEAWGRVSSRGPCSQSLGLPQVSVLLTPQPEVKRSEAVSPNFSKMKYVTALCVYYTDSFTTIKLKFKRNPIESQDIAIYVDFSNICKIYVKCQLHIQF